MKACGKSLQEGDIIIVLSDHTVWCEECSWGHKGVELKRGCLSAKAVKQLGKITCGVKIPIKQKATA
jgi:hypothetical protein